MTKDYAKRRLNQARPRKKTAWRIGAFYFTGIFVLFVAVVCFYGYKKYPEFQANPKFNNYLTQLKAIIHPAKQKQENLADNDAQADLNPQEPEIHFDFYNELPHMKVTASAQQQSGAAKQASQANKDSKYIIQFGTFKNALEASQLRVSLLLNGCEAEVVKMSTGQGGTYRVQRGPYITMTDAKTDQRQFQKKGIIGELKKL